MDQKVNIELLNHASVIIQNGSTSLLFDPWFEGTCFSDGWGLRYFYPGALEKATSCTHIWISHFHSDHFHMPTLGQIAERAPRIRVLANVSLNYDMQGPLKRCGFTTVTPLYERRSLYLSEDCEVIRYPATGIDNMLVVSMGSRKILNLNDCNIPLRAIRSLMRKIGPVDILLVNYNHAQKLLQDPSHELTKKTFKTRFHVVIETVKPKWVIPFASHHYYRSPSSANQNDSLLTVEELATIPSIVPLAVGDRAVFGSGQEPVIEMLSPRVSLAPMEAKRHKESILWESLMAAAEDYRLRLRNGFLGLVHWIPPVAIRADDLDRVFVLDVAKGISERRPTERPIHISAHSQSIFDWLGKPFGASIFWVGADFAIQSPDLRPIRLMMLAGLLVENRLALRDVLRMLATAEGWRFLLNRREEILWTLLNRRFFAGDSRMVRNLAASKDTRA